MACRLEESNLFIEVVMSVDMFSKLNSNVNRDIFSLSGTLRSPSLIHTPTRAEDYLLSST